MSDEHVRDADGGEHGGRGLAGVGAFVEPVHVLCADEDGLVAGASTSAGERGHRGAEDDLGLVVVLDQRDEAGEEGGGLGGCLVHLPVGSDERFAHVEGS